MMLISCCSKTSYFVTQQICSSSLKIRVDMSLIQYLQKYSAFEGKTALLVFSGAEPWSALASAQCF